METQLNENIGGTPTLWPDPQPLPVASDPDHPQMPTAQTQRPVPPWAERLAHAIPLFALPSGLWRLAVAFGFPWAC
jgi:hypothetical protein